MGVEELKQKVELILDIVSAGKSKLEGVRNILDRMTYASKDRAGAMASTLLEEYAGLHDISVSLCGEVERFNFGELKKYVYKDDWDKLRGEILDICHGKITEDDIKEFNIYLQKVVNASTYDDKQDGINKLKTKLEVHSTLYDKTENLFTDIKEHLEKITK